MTERGLAYAAMVRAQRKLLDALSKVRMRPEVAVSCDPVVGGLKDPDLKTVKSYGMRFLTVCDGDTHYAVCIPDEGIKRSDRKEIQTALAQANAAVVELQKHN